MTTLTQAERSWIVYIKNHPGATVLDLNTLGASRNCPLKATFELRTTQKIVRFSDTEVEAIRLHYAKHRDIPALAATHRCPKTVIGRIIRGELCPGAPGPVFPRKVRANRKAYAIALETRRLVSSLWWTGGYSVGELAKAAKCTEKEVRLILAAIRRRERELA